MSDWKDYCPIDEGESPAKRQAWHAGWTYRMERGAQVNKNEARRIAREMIDDYKPSLLPVWREGFYAADKVGLYGLTDD